MSAVWLTSHTRITIPVLLVTASVLAAQTGRVTTSQYNNSRTGANLDETILMPQTVNAKTFGKLATLTVDGAVYAQPLYLPHVTVPGRGTHNLLFIATERDSVYAFDADSLASKRSPGNACAEAWRSQAGVDQAPLGCQASDPIWRVSLLPKDRTSFPVPARGVQCPFISPVIGITSTPVIDAATGTLYVLARSGSRANLLAADRFSQHLHALAVTTGKEKYGGPVEIRASVKGTGEGSSGGEVQFDPVRENPRASLLLAKGVVYLAWGSSCDVSPYHGWVMAYDARTLRQLAVFNTSPNAGESGIWQSDTGPAADEHGNVYVSTGNGLFDAATRNGADYGDTLLKLKLQGNQLMVEDSFTPGNEQELNSTDGDLGSGGPVLLPDKAGTNPAALVFGGKEGVLYNIDPKRLGGLQRDEGSPVVQSMRIAKGIYAAAAYWNGTLYTFASEDWLKQFAVVNGRLAPTYSARSKQRSEFSGGTPTVSADGNRNAIVWVVESRAWNEGGTRAVLRAYDAGNVATQLYGSDENPARDQASLAVRFAIPTVANGRVYVGGVNTVDIYGLLGR